MNKPVTSNTATDVTDDRDDKPVASTTTTDVMDDREQRGALLRLGFVVVAGLVVAAFFGAFGHRASSPGPASHDRAPRVRPFRRGKAGGDESKRVLRRVSDRAFGP